MGVKQNVTKNKKFQKIGQNLKISKIIKCKMLSNVVLCVRKKPGTWY